MAISHVLISALVTLSLTRLVLSRYRSQVEPMPPWLEPALPPELVRICNSDKEFFFPFVPPSRESTPPGSP
jgi:hypothetical protein